MSYIRNVTKMKCYLSEMQPIQSALYENEPSRNVTYSKCIIRKCYLDEMLPIQSALYKNEPRRNVTFTKFTIRK